MLGVRVPPGLPCIFNLDEILMEEKAVKTKSKVQTKSNKASGMIEGWVTFFKEVKIEMKKVTWPPRREIVGSTTALLVATIIIGVFLGIVDLVLAEGIQPALTGNAGIMSAVTLVLFIGILMWVYKSN
jgi:preprotein translocase subunit SecE